MGAIGFWIFTAVLLVFSIIVHIYHAKKDHVQIDDNPAVILYLFVFLVFGLSVLLTIFALNNA